MAQGMKLVASGDRSNRKSDTTSWIQIQLARMGLP